MKGKRLGIVSRRLECPECGATFTTRYMYGRKRLRAPREKCPRCDYTARRGRFSITTR